MKRIFLSLLAAVVYGGVALRGSAAIPPAEALLPSDTLLMVTVPDCAAFRQELHQSPHWLFWNDPSMKPFRDKFISNYQEQFGGPLERDLGVKLADFLELPQGQFTFAVTANGWNGSDDNNSAGVVLLLDAREKSGLLQTNIAQLQKKWRADGKTIRTEEVGGIPFSVVTLASNDIPPTLQNIFPRRQPPQELGRETKPAKPGVLVVGQYQSLLIAGNSLKAVEPVIMHLAGGSRPALRDNPVFAADKLSQFRDQPLYYGWFNARDYFNILSQIPAATENPEAPSPLPQMPWQSILNASGFTGMKSVSFAYRESHDGSRLNLFISAPESARRGLFRIFSIVSREAGPPTFVPGDVVSYSRWRIDGRKAWSELQKALQDISPMAGSYLNSAIDIANATAQAKNPDFDLRKSLMGNLGDDFISYQKAPTGDQPAPTLFLFSAENPDQALLAIKTVASLMNAQSVPEPRTFMGRKIYTVPLPARRLPGAPAPQGRSIYCSTGNGYVAISGDSAMLEDFLRSSQSGARPLRNTPGFADAAQQVGGSGTGWFGYENQKETWRANFKDWKAHPAAAGGDPFAAFSRALPFGSLGNGLRSWMDFSLLPDFDPVAKYFYLSTYSGSMTPEGYTFKFYAPRPPQLH